MIKSTRRIEREGRQFKKKTTQTTFSYPPPVREYRLFFAAVLTYLAIWIWRVINVIMRALAANVRFLCVSMQTVTWRRGTLDQLNNIISFVLNEQNMRYKYSSHRIAYSKIPNWEPAHWMCRVYARGPVDNIVERPVMFCYLTGTYPTFSRMSWGASKRFVLVSLCTLLHLHYRSSLLVMVNCFLLRKVWRMLVSYIFIFSKKIISSFPITSTTSTTANVQ